MLDISSVLRHTIPISLFNRGQAGKIFEDVRRDGAKVVIKNNVAECVLISPEEYQSMVEEVNDARLLALAAKRMENCDPDHLLSEEDFDARLGFDKKDLAGSDEVEIE